MNRKPDRSPFVCRAHRDWAASKAGSASVLAAKNVETVVATKKENGPIGYCRCQPFPAMGSWDMVSWYPVIQKKINSAEYEVS